MLQSAIERLGASATNLVFELGRIASFFVVLVLQLMKPPFRFRRLVRETYDSGVLSLALVCASGLTVGLVLGLQLHSVLVRFGAEESLGAAIGLTLIRELGPVLTGLLVTGRAGSAMATEIAVMTATEQIDGMRTMAIDPMHFVVGPKALAITLAMPLLSSLFIVFSIIGAYLVAVQLLGLDAGVYFSSMDDAVEFRTDIVGSLLKALVFGALIALVATFRGYHSGRSAEAVGRATTSTVVTASVCILLADYVVTSLWEF
jgi:phospholipid/cholesterol/gamma-HCH transport system permease protein